jgi:transposase
VTGSRLAMIEWQGRRRPLRDVILELHAADLPVGEIARRLGVSYQIVYMVVQATSAKALAPAPAVGSKSAISVAPVAVIASRFA